ncbi:hypothetical protein FCOIX_13303 [Fusarium coicis]|nr:hypothetical protein FCOIX_13303 [Fusarium coicis]
MDFVQRLKSWTTTSNVKLCVLSREENPFMSSFSEAQRLRLHTLTQYDIKAYVLERLPSTESPRAMQALAKYIVEKASGVFFWVALVVRNVQRQWHLELEPAELRDIVHGFPRELNDLYWHILKELDDYSRKRAFQTLAMVPFVTGSGTYIRLDLLAYSFLNDYNQKETFAREDSFKANLMLSGWCRGLVEFDSRGNLGYAHRSVADFLESDDIQEEMAASLNVSDGEMVSGGLPYDLMSLRQKHDLDHKQFQFLRGMDAVFEPELKLLDDSALRHIEVHVRGSMWNIARRQVAVEMNNSLADCAAVLRFYFRDRLSSFGYTSKLNIINPDMRVNLMPDVGIFSKKEVYVSSTVAERHSIWQYFLIQEFYIWLDIDEYNSSSRFVGIVERFHRIGADHRFRFSTLVVHWATEAHLQPEPEDTFTFGNPDEPETLSFKRKWRNVGYYLDNRDEIDDVVGIDITLSKIRTWPCEPDGPRREISFAGWIRAMSDFPGKDDLLQLVEERAHDWQSLATSTSSEKNKRSCIS